MTTYRKIGRLLALFICAALNFGQTGTQVVVYAEAGSPAGLFVTHR